MTEPCCMARTSSSETSTGAVPRVTSTAPMTRSALVTSSSMVSWSLCRVCTAGQPAHEAVQRVDVDVEDLGARAHAGRR